MITNLYRLRVAQSQAGIASFLQDEKGWDEANQTLKIAYGAQHERKAKVCKAANTKTSPRV